MKLSPDQRRVLQTTSIIMNPWHIPDIAFFDRKLGSADFKLLSIIARHASPSSGWSTITRVEISRWMGYSSRSGPHNVARGIRRLVARGLLLQVSGTGRTPTHYRVLSPPELRP